MTVGKRGPADVLAVAVVLRERVVHNSMSSTVVRQTSMMLLCWLSA